MRKTDYAAIALAVLFVALATVNVAALLGAFDKPGVPQIRETTRTINYPNGTSVKIICTTQGSRVQELGDGTTEVIPLPIDTGTPQVGDLYINTCRGVKP